jgi:Domain of unknown function (DUF4340)
VRPRTTAILVVLGVLALAGGWFLGPGSTPSDQAAIPGGTLMFPGLAAKLKDAAAVEVTHQGKTVTLRKLPDGAWGVASLHDYKVQEPKLRGVLTALTELRLTEPRTSDPARYSRLGVDDPAKPESTGDLLQVSDAAGNTLAATIVGHRRVRSQADVPEEVYVRRPNDTQAWLAQGNLTADADPAQWLDRALIDVPSAKVAAVVVGNDTLMFDRKDGTFALRQPADHPPLDSYKVEDVSRALENLSLMAVKADADAPGGAETGHATFLTADGLALKVTVFHADKDVWARFSADGDNKAEAARLNARLGGWTFQLPTWKEQSLVPTLNDLKAAESAKPTESAAPPPADSGAK